MTSNKQKQTAQQQYYSKQKARCLFACFLPSVQFPLTPRNPYNQLLLNSKNLNLHNLLAVFKAHVLAWFILAPIKMRWKSYYHHRLYKLLYVTDENWRLTEVKWLAQRHTACLELNPSLPQTQPFTLHHCKLPSWPTQTTVHSGRHMDAGRNINSDAYSALIYFFSLFNSSSLYSFSVGSIIWPNCYLLSSPQK